jgi:hypothetical protein
MIIALIIILAILLGCIFYSYRQMKNTVIPKASSSHTSEAAYTGADSGDSGSGE